MYKALSPGALGFPVSFRDAAAVAAENGFEGYWFDLGRDLEEGMEACRERLSSTGLRPAGFGLPVDFRRDRESFEDALRALPQLATAARRLGLQRSTTYILPASDDLSYKENFELHRSRLRSISEILRDNDIRLGLEFVGPQTMRAGKKHVFIHNLVQTLELCEAIDTGNVGLLLDLFHWDTAGQSTEDFKRIDDESLVVLVHLNDAPEGRTMEEQLDNDRRLPGETGVLGSAPFLDGVASLGYTGPVVVEPFSATLKAMPFEEAVAATKASLDRVWRG